MEWSIVGKLFTQAGGSESMDEADGASDTVPALGAESSLVALLAAVQDAVIVLDLQRRFIRANPAACRIFGYSDDEFHGLPVIEILPEGGQEALAVSLGAIVQGGSVQEFASVLCRKNGERFPATLTASPITDDSGTPVGLVAVVQDRSGEETEGFTTFLTSLLSSSEMAIYATDWHGIVTWWNKSAERLYGYSRDEILGTSIRTLVPPEVESDEIAPVAGDMVTRQTLVDHHTIRLTKDGDRIPVSLTTFPIEKDDGQLMGTAIMARNLLLTPGSKETFAKIQRLTSRERDVLALTAEGLQNDEIAKRLHLSVQTVKNYVSRILMKLDATTRTQAAVAFMTWRNFLD